MPALTARQFITRDHAACLTAEQLLDMYEVMLLALFGKAEDPSSGGRQMPSHFGCAPSRMLAAY